MYLNLSYLNTVKFEKEPLLFVHELSLESIILMVLVSEF